MSNGTLSSTDLLHGPVGKILLQFSLPFMFSTLLQTLYSTVDTVIVGQYLGASGLSAVSNGSLLVQMLYMVCIGFSNAGQILIAQAQGSKNTKETKKIAHALFVLELFLAVGLGAGCVLFRWQFVTLLQVPTDAAQQAVDYTVICGVGLLFTGLYNMFSAVLRGMGDSKDPLKFVIVASIINVILDIVFIQEFRWGVAGAALATIIGQAVSVIFSIVLFYKKEALRNLLPSLKGLILERKTVRLIIKLGVPMAIQGTAIQFSFLFVGRMVNSLGLEISAAFGVAQKLRNLPGILTQGLGLGATSMIGQNWGAKKLNRVSATINWSILLCGGINLLLGLAYLLAPTVCFRAFTQEEAVLEYASLCMLTLVVELPGRSTMPGCGALISAQGFVQFSFVIGFVDAFVGRVLFCWLLGTVMGLGALGFFLGYSVGTYLTAIPQIIYYGSGLWKRRKVLMDSVA